MASNHRLAPNRQTPPDLWQPNGSAETRQSMFIVQASKGSVFHEANSPMAICIMMYHLRILPFDKSSRTKVLTSPFLHEIAGHVLRPAAGLRPTMLRVAFLIAFPLPAR